MTREELEQLDAKRLRYLKEMHEETRGEEMYFVTFETIETRLGIDRMEGHRIRQYLIGEGLLQGRSNTMISMTHAGVVEYEKAMRGEETPHFSLPVVVTIFNNSGTITNSNVQQNSPHGSQALHQTMNATELLQLRETLNELATKVSEFGLDADGRLRLEADLASARMQLETNKPNLLIVREGIRSVRAILEGIAANALTAAFAAKLAGFF